MAFTPDIRVGCCGFALAQPEYFRRFRLVEVQQSFYQPPRLETLRRWRQRAPRDFEFTLKAWQLITHECSSPTYRRLRERLPPRALERCGSFRPTAEVARAWAVTRAAAAALGATAVVFQCPPSFAPSARNIARLRRFFRARAAERNPFRLCWEPRGAWPRATAAALCGELGLELVVDPFSAEPPADGFRYFRLHGVGGYRHRYSDAELERLWAMCRGTTYCLFNNLTMAEDAARFLALVRRRAGRG